MPLRCRAAAQRHDARCKGELGDLKITACHTAVDNDFVVGWIA